MSSNAVDEEHVNAAAAYIGRVSPAGSFRSEKAVLLVTDVGLAIHRPGRFEKYRAIPYEEVNAFDLRRRWNGMVLSIGADSGEFRFRFFRPRGDLAAIVVSLNQRLQSDKRPLRPRYALTQVSTDDDNGDREPSPKPRSQGASEQSPGDAALGSGAADQSLRTNWNPPKTGGRRSSSATRVFAGDRTAFAPLIRPLPKLIMFCLTLYSVVASGLWDKGIDTITGWLSMPAREEAATQPVIVEEPSVPDLSAPPALAEDNLAHVRIDLSMYPDLASTIETQRLAMQMSQMQAAEAAGLDRSTVQKIEAASDVVSLSHFLRYAKAIHLDIAIIRNILDSR